MTGVFREFKETVLNSLFIEHFRGRLLEDLSSDVKMFFERASPHSLRDKTLAKKYMFKFNCRNTRKRSEICSN